MTDGFIYAIQTFTDPNAAKNSEIGQLRSETRLIEDQIVVENLFPEVKANLPPNALTDKEIKGIIRESMRQQRILTPFTMRFSDARLEDIFKRSRLMGSREADKRKASGPGQRFSTRPVRVSPIQPPSMRKFIHVPQLSPPMQKPSAAHPSSPGPVNGATGLKVHFRVNILPIKIISQVKQQVAGSATTKHSVRIAISTRETMGQGNEAIVLTLALTAPRDSAGEINQSIVECMRSFILAASSDLAVSVRRKLQGSASPSRPGRPPGADTGLLAQSIRFVMDGDGLGAWIGTDVEYAQRLEFGTVNMASRPFLLPSFEVAKAKFKRDVREKIRTILS